MDLDKVLETDQKNVVKNEHDLRYEEEAELDDAEIGDEGEDDGIFRVYEPDDLASTTLNAFIRVLISKLPSQQLHTFWYTSPPRIV